MMAPPQWDYMELEQERGITITFCCGPTCTWSGSAGRYGVIISFNIIDTPGHVDFTIEVERSFACFLTVEWVVFLMEFSGVEPQSETVWRQANKFKVPRICFINKLDRAGADFEKAVGTIRERLQAKAVPIQIPVGAEDKLEGIIDLVTEKANYL